MPGHTRQPLPQTPPPPGSPPSWLEELNGFQGMRAGGQALGAGMDGPCDPGSHLFPPLGSRNDTLLSFLPGCGGQMSLLLNAGEPGVSSESYPRPCRGQGRPGPWLLQGERKREWQQPGPCMLGLGAAPSRVPAVPRDPENVLSLVCQLRKKNIPCHWKPSLSRDTP